MTDIRLQPARTARILCSICMEPIEPAEPALYESWRNWHAHVKESCEERFKRWIDEIDEDLLSRGFQIGIIDAKRKA